MEVATLTFDEAFDFNWESKLLWLKKLESVAAKAKPKAKAKASLSLDLHVVISYYYTRPNDKLTIVYNRHSYSHVYLV